MLRVIPYPPPRSMMNGDRPSNGFSRFNPSGGPTTAQQQQFLLQQQQQQQLIAQQKETPRPTAQQISRTYKTCTNLFLTRRLPEALATLLPVVAESANPRGKCSRVLRIKVWSLYFAILDAAAKMGSEQGKKLWGAAEWRKIVQKIRTAKVWDEAVEAYTSEGRVDADVVIALVMLLLCHAPEQKTTQKRIEAYMSASSSVMSHDDDPKALAQRVKLTQLYVLHVLPKVDEWDYAREFTQGCGDLDDAQKEQFLATLDALLKEKEEAEKLAEELEQRRNAELADSRRQSDADGLSSTSRQRDVSPSIAGSVRSNRSSKPRRKRSPEGTTSRSKASTTGGRLDVPTTQEAAARRQSTSAATTAAAPGQKDALHTRHQTSSLFGHTQALFNKMQKAMFSGQGNSLLLRTVLMVCAVVYATSKKKVRERIKKLLILAWLKTSRTVGMGIKVTYI